MAALFVGGVVNPGVHPVIEGRGIKGQCIKARVIEAQVIEAQAIKCS